MSDGDFGGDFGVDSSAFDGGSMDGMDVPGTADFASDYGPPLEPTGGEVGPPEQVLYTDALQGPPQADVGRGAHSTGFVASGGAGHAGGASVMDYVVPAMMLGSMASVPPRSGTLSTRAPYAGTRSAPIGCASMFFMALFVGVALIMAGAAFRSGFGLLGLIPIAMAVFAVISIATAGARQGAPISAVPFDLPPTSPMNNVPPPARFCAYCGRLAQGLEAGCAGCGGPIDGKPKHGRGDRG